MLLMWRMLRMFRLMRGDTGSRHHVDQPGDSPWAGRLSYPHCHRPNPVLAWRIRQSALIQRLTLGSPHGDSSKVVSPRQSPSIWPFRRHLQTRYEGRIGSECLGSGSSPWSSPQAHNPPPSPLAATHLLRHPPPRPGAPIRRRRGPAPRAATRPGRCLRGLAGSPRRDLAANLIASGSVQAAPEWLHSFSGMSAPHPDDHRARKDGIRQPPKARQSDRRVGGYFLGFDDLAFDDTPACNSSASMSGIEQSADFFVLLRLWPEHRVDLVIEDRGALLAADLAKQVGRADVHGGNGIRNKKLRDFHRSRLSRCRFGRQEGNPGCRFQRDIRWV